LEDADNETPFQPEHNNDNLSFETDQDVMRRKQERLQKVLDASLLWKKLGPKLQTHTEIEYYDDPDLFQNRPWPERAIVTAGGVIFNLLLAFCIYFETQDG
jgi:membrane-associated protease RseP (regulator of RpoE activity)